MTRLHLFEFEDQSWFPAVIRDPATAYLRFVTEKSGQAEILAGRVKQALERSGRDRILDLCSGGAGPLLAVVRHVRESGLPVGATMTDLFPNAPAFQLVAGESEGAIDYDPAPVDATSVPSDKRGLRTLFNSFHHFRPEPARRILQDAVDARAPIGVYELVGRNPVVMIGIALAPIFVMLVMPAIRPFRWTNLLFTYLIPLIPLLVVWDGLVSCLRVYSEDELRALVAELKGGEDWEWDVGRFRLGGPPVYATYLEGYPPASTRAQETSV